MTDEEKATEISEKNRITYSHLSGESGTWFMSSEDECFCSALEMAEWKDKQFAEEKKQWIEKAAKWLEDNQRAYNEYDESGFYHERSQNLIKDFKKAMEE